MKMRPLMVGAVSIAFLAASVIAAEAINLENVKCVVNAKGPAKAGTEVDYKGGKVFFCCQNCPKAFAADTEKFSTKANAQLAQTKQAKQVKCPLSGQDCNAEKTVKVAGVSVAFCCDNCKGKVEKAEGDEQLGLVFANKAFEKGFKVGDKK